MATAVTLSRHAMTIVAVNARVVGMLLTLLLVVPLAPAPFGAGSVPAVGDVTTVETNVVPPVTTSTVLVTGASRPEDCVDLPFTVMNPTAAPPVGEEVVAVVSVEPPLGDDDASTPGVGRGCGGVRVGGVGGVTSAGPPASVRPGVSGCVARMDRSTSRQRICMAGPTVMSAPAAVAVRETPQMPPRKSVVSDVHVCPLYVTKSV